MAVRLQGQHYFTFYRKTTHYSHLKLMLQNEQDVKRLPTFFPFLLNKRTRCYVTKFHVALLICTLFHLVRITRAASVRSVHPSAATFRATQHSYFIATAFYWSTVYLMWIHVFVLSPRDIIVLILFAISIILLARLVSLISSEDKLHATFILINVYHLNAAVIKTGK
jgi:hypothetical protein